MSDLPPIYISFALAFHCSADPEEHLGRDHFNSAAGREVRQWLFDNDMIRRGEGNSVYPTAKLSTWIKGICSTPLPVREWAIPSWHDHNIIRNHNLDRLERDAMEASDG